MLKFNWIYIYTALLVFSSVATADFPAEEVWRVEFDTTATALGPSWQDDGGQTFFLVGTADRALIISEGEVVWESPELPGYVSALNRVDFGVGDGPEIIVGTVDTDSGRIHVFRGDNYQDHDEYAILGGNHTQTEKYIRSIGFFESNLPDQSKIVIVGNRRAGGSEYPHGYQDWVAGEIRTFSIQDDRLFEEIHVGEIINTLPYDLRNGEEVLIIGSQRRSFNVFDFYPYCESYSRAEIRLFNDDMEITGEIALADYESNRRVEDYAHLYSLQVLEREGEEDELYVSFKDSSGYRLAKLSLPHLEVRGIIELPRANNIHVYYHQEINRISIYLICITSGWMSIVDAVSFECVDRFRFSELPSIDASLDDFNGDDDFELVYLTPALLILFDLGTLEVSRSLTSTDLCDSYSITTAYPNPFNARTTIEYQLSHPGRYTLSVIDLTGAEITRLVDGWNSAGTYRAVWDARGMTSGSYMIRLETDGVNAARKVQLVR